MEKEYESRIKYVEERIDLSEQSDESQFETEMNEEDVKRTLHEVLKIVTHNHISREQSLSSLQVLGLNY